MLTPFRLRPVSQNIILRFGSWAGAAKAKDDYKTTKVSQIPSSRFYCTFPKETIRHISMSLIKARTPPVPSLFLYRITLSHSIVMKPGNRKNTQNHINTCIEAFSPPTGTTASNWKKVANRQNEDVWHLDCHEALSCEWNPLSECFVRFHWRKNSKRAWNWPRPSRAYVHPVVKVLLPFLSFSRRSGWAIEKSCSTKRREEASSFYSISIWGKEDWKPLNLPFRK